MMIPPAGICSLTPATIAPSVRAMGPQVLRDVLGPLITVIRMTTLDRQMPTAAHIVSVWDNIVRTKDAVGPDSIAALAEAVSTFAKDAALWDAISREAECYRAYGAMSMQRFGHRCPDLMALLDVQAVAIASRVLPYHERIERAMRVASDLAESSGDHSWIPGGDPTLNKLCGILLLMGELDSARRAFISALTCHTAVGRATPGVGVASLHDLNGRYEAMCVPLVRLAGARWLFPDLGLDFGETDAAPVVPLFPLFRAEAPIPSAEYARLQLEPIRRPDGTPVEVPLLMQHLWVDPQCDTTRRLAHLPITGTLPVIRKDKGLQVVRTLEEKLTLLEAAALDVALTRQIRARCAQTPLGRLERRTLNTQLDAKLFALGLAEPLPFVSIRYKGIGARYAGRIVASAAVASKRDDEVVMSYSSATRGAMLAKRALIGAMGIFLDEPHQPHSRIPIGAAARDDVIAIQRDAVLLSAGAVLSVLNLDGAAVLDQTQIPELTIPRIHVTMGVVLDTTVTLEDLSHPQNYEAWITQMYGDFETGRARHLRTLCANLGRNLFVLMACGFTVPRLTVATRKDISAFGGLKDTGELEVIEGTDWEPFADLVRLWIDDVVLIAEACGLGMRQFIDAGYVDILVGAFLGISFEEGATTAQRAGMLRVLSEQGVKKFHVALCAEIFRLWSQMHGQPFPG